MPDPKPPRPRPVPLVPVVPTRGDRRSHDNVEAVLAQEAHERRERELLAKLAEEQEARAEAERKAAEAERRAQQPARVEASVPPKDGALDIRARLTPQQLVTMIVSISALIGTAVNFVRSEPKPAQVVDNSAPIMNLTATQSAQGAEIAAIKKHIQDGQDWEANAFEAACVDVTRPVGSRPLPQMETSSTNVKRKCPAVKLETPQPVLP